MAKPVVKALFTIDYGKERMQKIRDLGIEVMFINESRMHDENFAMDPNYRDADMLICFNPFEKMALEHFKKLKFIQLVSVGFNHIPKEFSESTDIKICHNVGTTRYPIAEWIMTQILQIYKNSRLFYRQQQDKEWKVQKDILELSGKTVTFLGAGNIVVETARKLKAFDALTYALRRSEKPAEYIDHVLSIDKIDEILPISDIVISALPATPDTFHLLNRERIGLMKHDSVIVNISRGTVIDETALTQAIQQGKFRGVALDVFEQEPLPKKSPLWEQERVFITPHNAIFSDSSDERVYQMIYSNIVNFIEGKELLNQVNFERGY